MKRPTLALNRSAWPTARKRRRPGAPVRSALLALVIALVGACCTTAGGEPFLARPIKIIGGQGPGATSDVLARIIGPKLSELLGQPVVIEAHAGAAGTIGAKIVADSPADGYTLLLASSSNLALAAVNVQNLPYDPVRDFAPIGRIASIPWTLAVNSRLPAKTIPELIAYAKANPGKLTGGSTGPGSAASFGLQMLSSTAGIDILDVPYKTNAAAVLALVTGEVDMEFNDLGLVDAHLKAGTLRLVAAAGSRRLRAYPGLPTMAEQGVAGFALEPWYGLAAPAGTPAEILARLTEGLSEVRRMPEVRQSILRLGYDPIEDTPAEFVSAIHTDIAKFSAAARRAATKSAP